MATGYHLPHNAVVVEEFKFMLSLLDISKEYYLYDELKSLFLEEMIKNGLFEKFHKGMYKRINNSDEMKNVYEKIKIGELGYDSIKKLYYTDKDKKPKKNFNQNWNEIVRDYLEFMAFIGFLPTYYKGKSKESEKKHYLSNTLKLYLNNEYSLQSALLGMKFRNASKDYSNFDMYDIKLRPFVIVLKILEYAKDKNMSYINGTVLSALVKLQSNELLENLEDVDLINKNNNGWTDSQIREFNRGLTFMKQWINHVLRIPIRKGKEIFFDLTDYDIKKYDFFENSVYVGERYKYIEVTPQIANIIKDPSKSDNIQVLQVLEEYNLIKKGKQNAHINYDIDLPNRELALESYSIEEENNKIQMQVDKKVVKLELKKQEEYKRGYEISIASDGTAYEEFIYEQVCKAFTNFEVRKLGSHYTGQRVSDIEIDCQVYYQNVISNIKIIIECKAGKAIKSLDERKEKDNIDNTLKSTNINSYDGVWYILVANDNIPKKQHGGYRSNNNSLSFEEKLLALQFHTQMSVGKPSIVTAFSFEMFMNFLSEIKDNNGIITNQTTKDFWVWSKRFVNMSYVSIQA